MNEVESRLEMEAVFQRIADKRLAEAQNPPIGIQKPRHSNEKRNASKRRWYERNRLKVLARIRYLRIDEEI